MGPRLTPIPLPLDPVSRAIRRARVAELARAVREGRYAVPAEEVAAAVVDFHRRWA